MILPVQTRVREHLAAVLAQLYGLDPTALPPIALEYPPTRELGDLGTPVAFELARRLRKAPRAIAAEIAGAFGVGRRVSGRSSRPRTAISTSFSTGRPSFVERLGRAPAAAPAARGQGHRRAHGHQSEQGGPHRPPAQRRARRHAGARAALPRHPVEVQNYIDDTGVQVADVVVGFRVLEGRTLDEIPPDRRHARASITTAGTSTRG